MTRNDFYAKLEELNGGNSPPTEPQAIDINKIIDTITVRLDNKLNSDLEKLYNKLNERNEVQKDDRDITEVERVNQERRIQGNEDTESNTN